MKEGGKWRKKRKEGRKEGGRSKEHYIKRSTTSGYFFGQAWKEGRKEGRKWRKWRKEGR